MLKNGNQNQCKNEPISWVKEGWGRGMPLDTHSDLCCTSQCSPPLSHVLYNPDTCIEQTTLYSKPHITILLESVNYLVFFMSRKGSQQNNMQSRAHTPFKRGVGTRLNNMYLVGNICQFQIPWYTENYQTFGCSHHISLPQPTLIALCMPCTF